MRSANIKLLYSLRISSYSLWIFADFVLRLPSKCLFRLPDVINSLKLFIRNDVWQTRNIT